MTNRDDDHAFLYNLMRAEEKLKWFLYGFAGGIGACFLVAVLA